MRSPGTLTILGTLTNSYNKPGYAGAYHFTQERRRANRPPRSKSNPLIGRLLSLLALAGYLACYLGSTSVLKIIGDSGAVGLVALGLLVPMAGNIGIASGVSLAITQERERQSWPFLLLLPYERYQIVLHSVVYAYFRVLVVPIAAFAATAMAGVVLIVGETISFRAFALIAMIGIETLQWVAFSIAAGVGSAGSKRTSQEVFIPVLYGITVGVTRGAAGWLVAYLAGVSANSQAAAIIVGPLSIVVIQNKWGIGLLVGVFYLCALEMVVRRLFAWSIARTGE
jgi:hypothetical protein